jgi:hypothetical protein
MENRRPRRHLVSNSNSDRQKILSGVRYIFSDATATATTGTEEVKKNEKREQTVADYVTTARF